MIQNQMNPTARPDDHASPMLRLCETKPPMP